PCSTPLPGTGAFPMSRRPRAGSVELLISAAAVLIIGALAPAGATAETTAAAQSAAQSAATAHGLRPAVISKRHLLPTGTSAATKPGSKLVGFRTGARQAVFVQLSGAGAAAISRTTFGRTGGTVHTRSMAAASAAAARRSAIAHTAATVMAAARRADAKSVRLFEVGNAVPGVGVIADSAAVRRLARRADVVKISPIVAKTVLNANTAGLTRAVNTWHD